VRGSHEFPQRRSLTHHAAIWLMAIADRQHREPRAPAIVPLSGQGTVGFTNTTYAAQYSVLDKGIAADGPRVHRQSPAASPHCSSLDSVNSKACSTVGRRYKTRAFSALFNASRCSPSGLTESLSMRLMWVLRLPRICPLLAAPVPPPPLLTVAAAPATENKRLTSPPRTPFSTLILR
jgi:hypothetical protein